jgi:hypothetical protein
MYEPATEDALAVTHPGYRTREAAIADGRCESTQRRRVNRRRGLRRIRYRRPMELLKAPLELVRFHGLSIRPRRVTRNRIASTGDVV